MECGRFDERLELIYTKDKYFDHFVVDTFVLSLIINHIKANVFNLQSVKNNSASFRKGNEVRDNNPFIGMSNYYIDTASRE